MQLSGIDVDLWLPQGLDEWGTNNCTCIKANTPDKGGGSPDIICKSCYGLGYLGGYHKYGYNYIDISSVDTTLTYNPSNMRLNTNLRPFRLELVDGVDSSYVTTNTIPFTFYNQFGGTEYQLDKYLRDTNNALEVFYNVGSGWAPIANINTIVDGLTKNIQFRITLHRHSGERSPQFEFLRIRSKRLDLKDHFIRISRSRNSQDIGKSKTGLSEGQGNPTYWTLLDFELTPRSFIEITEATNPYYGERYELFQFNKSFFDVNRFRQMFSTRQVSRDKEIISGVF